MTTMRNRKTIIVAFVLVACMLIGVGYALVTNTLDITGSGTINQSAAEESFNQDIFFSGVVVNGNIDADGVTAEDNMPYTANINANNNDKAQFTITGLKGQNDTAEIVFRVENAGDLDADLYIKSVTNSNVSYFNVEYYVNGQKIDVTNTTDSFASLAKKTGGSNTTLDITVKVIVVATPTSQQSFTSTFEFDAKSDDVVAP